jgi:tRNA pseudouridine38-40 synthase
MRVALGIEYSGCHYFGWQKQDISPTVQEALESALSEVADEKIHVICAGRTDTGVHALQQVVHFDTSVQRETKAWQLGANTKLPKDIAVTWALNVDDEFHARFSAENRTYQYLILNRRARPAVYNGLVTWEYQKLDFDRMKQASLCLLGEHDFTSFRASACQAKSPIRTIHQLDIKQSGDWYLITISANAFLHHMVRNISGVLMAIGKGKKEIIWCNEVLESKDRKAAGVTAPPHGLYLVDIKYPEKYIIPMPDNLMNRFGFN